MKPPLCRECCGGIGAQRRPNSAAYMTFNVFGQGLPTCKRHAVQLAKGCGYSIPLSNFKDAIYNEDEDRDGVTSAIQMAYIALGAQFAPERPPERNLQALRDLIAPLRVLFDEIDQPPPTLVIDRTPELKTPRPE